MIYLGNAFSCQMISGLSMAVVREIGMTTVLSMLLVETPITSEDGMDHWGIKLDDSVVNAIGHEDIAAVISHLLNIEAPAVTRPTVTMVPGDRMIVAQYCGPRLAAGTTELPEGATIKWYMVVVEEFS